MNNLISYNIKNSLKLKKGIFLIVLSCLFLVNGYIQTTDIEGNCVADLKLTISSGTSKKNLVVGEQIKFPIAIINRGTNNTTTVDIKGENSINFVEITKMIK